YFNNFDLYENSSGEVWVLNSNGIYIAKSDDLVANENIDPMRYSISDGLPCIATANSYSELTEEGDLYIAGTTGVAKVNIEEPYDSVGNLKAAVPYIEADGERVYPDESGMFKVPFNVRKLTIYGFVYNYSLINPQVNYQLVGFDTEPVTVTRSNLGPVDYTNLQGGTYEFVMQLRDPVSRRYKTVSVRIVKEKAFYEYARFYVFMSILLVSLIALAVNRYTRRMTQRLEKKHREEAEKERIAADLHMANQIQSAVLPSVFPAFPDRSEFDIYATMNPAREVGGDFYDFFMIDDDHLGLVMADVSGKGIPAALFMMNAKSIVQNCAMLGRSPADILTKTNEAVCKQNKMEMFVTVWVGILEISTGILTAANAGHEYPAVRRAGGEFELFKDKHGFVVGGMEGIRYKEYSLSLSPGDKLFLYTDGVPEASDSGQQLFGTERMLAALNQDPEASPETILENERRSVDRFVQNAEQFDDLTMMCLEYKGAQ
ncbi:MAG: serine/threonine-protein phosphatase, partial [Lachnospiraceae bacterium]|nr:serine/threonine-protein phosphatase [Lachnospiraceae bacterium]